MKQLILFFASIYCACAAGFKCVVHFREVEVSEKTGIAPPDNTISFIVVGFFCVTAFLFAYLAKQSK